MSAAPATVTSILGETKSVEFTWPDGSHQCPFCGYPAAGECENPGCPASKYATPANRHRFEEAAREAEKRAAEDATRKRNHELALQRIEREQAEAAEARRKWRLDVMTAGGCLACSNHYTGKIRRHRGECPKAQPHHRLTSR